MTMKLNQIIDEVNKIVLGKSGQVKLALACIAANGHLLIEDIPGMGKTTLAHSLSKALGLEYSRVQFTSDMLPSDVLGASIFHRESQSFKFHKGPVFSNVVLADEINRATPKAQSALLEAMEERQVSIEGETYQLPRPFFVIATQNPLEQAGTFPLPESQLDRFLMRITLGYPAESVEKQMYMGANSRQLLDALQPLLDNATITEIQKQVEAVTVSDVLVEYVMRIVSLSRQLSPEVNGLSPRGGLALIRAAKAWAYIESREFVLPEDVQMVLEPVVLHRIRGNQPSNKQLAAWIADLKSVSVPR
jgi:MoxR-like ATPase